MRYLFSRKNKTKPKNNDWEINDPDWGEDIDNKEEKVDWERSWGHIQRDVLVFDKRQKRKRLLVQGGAIGLFILVILYSLPFFKNTDNKTQEFTLYNKDKFLKSYLLADSSVVLLYPDSKLILSNRYNIDSREIQLLGSADFKVHKNKNKPFIVYSSHLITKAIGTEFLIGNNATQNEEYVYLEEGIVQVNINNQIKRHILSVGDTLSYDSMTGLVRLSSFVNKRALRYNRTRFNPSKTTALDAVKDKNKPTNNLRWYSFDNMSLTSLFGMLENIYGKHIVYNQETIGSRYFIGKFEKSDSLEHIIKVITSLNGLDYSKKTDGDYLIYQKN